MKKTKLIVGQRYWLDGRKDISGIFLGRDYRGNRFGSLENNYIYIADKNGEVHFYSDHYYYEV